MSQRFSLKWKDFQSVVSQSFSVLRQEQDFYDVTLVSEDETQIQAHKLVLSASSSFFKSILKKNSHSHPLLYLSGVDSKCLGFVLDYIYEGKVQIYQGELDRFLETAQKLKVEGLLSTGDPEPSDSDYKEVSQFKKPKQESFNIPTELKTEKQYHKENPVNDEYEKIERINDMSEAESKIQQLITERRENSGIRHCCTVCDYSSFRKAHVKEHVELHIEDLCYPCQHCDKTFRSKNVFRRHRCMNK